jgi:cytochrome c5
VKQVTNDNGGTANASAWTLTATGSGGFSGNGAPATGTTATLGPTNVTANVQYTLSESGGPSGYTAGTAWSCTGGGTFATPNKITLAPGDNVTCTITNNDVAPRLTLAKHVINNDGGTANASAWTLTATGSGGFSGNGSPATGTDASLGPNNVTAGVQYTLSESGGPSDYTAGTTWSCTGGGTFTSPDKITLGVGDNVTCTITNDDNARGRASIAPTATTCEAFATNSFSTLATLLATVKANKINTVSPGVFFFYAEVVVPAGGGAVAFTQTVIPGTMTLPLYQVQQSQAFLYTFSGGTCTKVATLTLNQAQTSGTTGTVAQGTYILGVKFSPDAAKNVSTPSNTVANDLLSTHRYGVVGGLGAQVETRVKP